MFGKRRVDVRGDVEQNKPCISIPLVLREISHGYGQNAIQPNPRSRFHHWRLSEKSLTFFSYELSTRRVRKSSMGFLALTIGIEIW